jgi:lysophospholipase L1-like esterase
MESSTILCIGDSHTAGFPDFDPLMGGNPESSYQFWLHKGLEKKRPEKDFRLINQGMCGDTSKGIVRRLLSTFTTIPCDLVILAGGTNDLGMIGVKQIFTNLQEGYKAVRERQLPLVVPSIPPISIDGYVERVTSLNHEIEAYALSGENVFFGDWFGALKDEDGFLDERYNAGDGVHLSIAGYERIGSLLVPLVSTVLS